MILIIAVIFIGLYFLMGKLFQSAWGTKTDDHTTDH